MILFYIILLVLIIIFFFYSIYKLLNVIYPNLFNNEKKSVFNENKNINNNLTTITISNTPINFYLNKYLLQCDFEETNNIFRFKVSSSSINCYKFKIAEGNNNFTQFILFKQNEIYYFTENDSKNSDKIKHIQDKLCKALNIEEIGYFNRKMYTIKTFNHTTNCIDDYSIYEFYPSPYIEWLNHSKGWYEVKWPETQLKIVINGIDIIDASTNLNTAIFKIKKYLIRENIRILYEELL